MSKFLDDNKQLVNTKLNLNYSDNFIKNLEKKTKEIDYYDDDNFDTNKQFNYIENCSSNNKGTGIWGVILGGLLIWGGIKSISSSFPDDNSNSSNNALGEGDNYNNNLESSDDYNDCEDSESDCNDYNDQDENENEDNNSSYNEFSQSISEFIRIKTEELKKINAENELKELKKERVLYKTLFFILLILVFFTIIIFLILVYKNKINFNIDSNILLNYKNKFNNMFNNILLNIKNKR